jgi:SAM-dependent methyltransferase
MLVKLDPAAYGRAFATHYDALYADDPADRSVAEVVLALAPDRPAPLRILELGVGTGRFALPLARAGAEVTGIDVSPEMLAICASKDPPPTLRLLTGDMRDLRRLRLPRFDVVLILFNSLLHLLTAREQRQALEQAAGVLEPDGVMVVEVTAPDRVRPALLVDVGLRSIGRDHVTVRARCHLPGQRVTGVHVELGARGLDVRRFSHRYVTARELVRMAEEAGLGLCEARGGWDERHAGSTPPTVFLFAAR